TWETSFNMRIMDTITTGSLMMVSIMALAVFTILLVLLCVTIMMRHRERVLSRMRQAQ
ncbi:hypothetical protein AAVH_06878, partial [Aphelenchoides avenae]